MNKLTGAEALVMKAIWELDREVKAADIYKRILQDYGQDWTKQTISSFIHILVMKRFIEMHRNKGICTYTIMITRVDFMREQLTQIKDFWYDGNKEAMMKDLKELEI